MAKQESDTGRLDPGIWRVSAVVLLGPFMTNIDSTVVNVSLSTLARELHASLGSIQWVISGYLLALALMLPLSGWLVDRIGAKRVYLGCFTAFTVASMFCGIAHSSAMLIACRAVQGMAGGLLAPMAQLMIARIAGQQMAKVLGYTVMPILIAPILGPVVAGEVLQHGSWRWLFFLNLPIGILAVTLAAILLPKDEATLKPRHFDLKGFLLLSPGLVALLYGLEHALEVSGRISAAIGALMLGGFLVYARKLGSAALLDLGLFGNRVFSAAAALQFLSNAMIFSGQMLIPLFLISISHFSPEKTGAVVMSMGLGMLCSYPLMGPLTERFGCRPVSSAGSLIAFAGTLPLAWMAWSGVITPVLCACLFIRGSGMGAISIPSISAAYSSVSKDRLPVATTTINIVQRVGGPIATTFFAIFLGLCAQKLHLHGALTFAAAFILLAAIHASNFLCALRLPMRIHSKTAEEVPVKLDLAATPAE